MLNYVCDAILEKLVKHSLERDSRSSYTLHNIECRRKDMIMFDTITNTFCYDNNTKKLLKKMKIRKI